MLPQIWIRERISPRPGPQATVPARDSNQRPEFCIMHCPFANYAVRSTALQNISAESLWAAIDSLKFNQITTSDACAARHESQSTLGGAVAEIDVQFACGSRGEIYSPKYCGPPMVAKYSQELSMRYKNPGNRYAVALNLTQRGAC